MGKSLIYLVNRRKVQNYDFSFIEIGNFGYLNQNLHKMKKNIGTIDMIVRMLLGVAVLFIGWYFNTWWGLLGLLPLATGLLGWCPAYYFLKRSTLKKEMENV
jgi:hypothetical protein